MAARVLGSALKRAESRQRCYIASMDRERTKNQLIVRNLEEEVVRELKLRAARHGRSAEAEHREILRQALLPTAEKKPFKALLLAIPQVGEDADFARREERGREVDL
jgi:plasmid stability protein